MMRNDLLLYNSIGDGYNMTRQPDQYLVSKLTEFLTPTESGLYLDIGCGTGNYTTAIANNTYDFVGVEPSGKMLEMAKTKSPKTRWLMGSAEHIPTESTIFDGVIATLTIHHWTNLYKAFEELYRVIKAGGKIVLFTATPIQMKGYWLNHYFPKMMKKSLNQMPTYESIKVMSEKIGYTNIFCETYFVKDDLTDLFLYAGKNRPELYLDETVRKGISSFANLALKEEVNRGLLNLDSDINKNNISEIIAGYENKDGDYLFIIIEK